MAGALEGLGILRVLNDAAAQSEKVPEEPPERVLRELRCQVYGCQSPAIWRCSDGFRYCDLHTKLPHDWPLEHAFHLIASEGKPAPPRVLVRLQPKPELQPNTVISESNS